MQFDEVKAAKQIAGYLKLTRAHFTAPSGYSESPTLILRRMLAMEMDSATLRIAHELSASLTPYNGEAL